MSTPSRSRLQSRPQSQRISVSGDRTISWCWPKRIGTRFPCLRHPVRSSCRLGFVMLLPWCTAGMFHWGNWRLQIALAALLQFELVSIFYLLHFPSDPNMLAKCNDHLQRKQTWPRLAPSSCCTAVQSSRLQHGLVQPLNTCSSSTWEVWLLTGRGLLILRLDLPYR